MKSLATFNTSSWESAISKEIRKEAIEALEGGKVLYFPSLAFDLKSDEKQFLSPEIVDPKTKNISFDSRNNRLSGSLCTGEQQRLLTEMVKRYALTSRQFLETLIPHYSSHLIQARTSFRPVEISGRKNPSYRKDDTLLHVDSFPSSPTKGQRILRVFTNVNPNGKPRVWRLGEPFQEVVNKICPKASRPIPGLPLLLKLLGITKDYRTAYDHYMLQIHDTMKGDIHYQSTVHYDEVELAAGSTWIVYTDQVSHSALSGQHVFEQTFHLPIEGIQNPATTPLKVLEKYLDRVLV